LLLRSVARHAHAPLAAPPPTITPIPTLPASAPEPPAETLGAGALVARMRFARDTAVRVRAVLATRRLDGARATPLLREALRDRQEDVRLLAYALLEDREQQADKTVRGLLAALGAAPASRKAALHDRLANAYWELCYQELVAGELEAFALGQVIEQLDAAEATGGVTAPRWLLRARVLLRQGDAVGAREALDESRRHGMPARTLDPYLAETRFVARSLARSAARARGVIA
jgi:polysaccharide biosynthesis protein PelE